MKNPEISQEHPSAMLFTLAHTPRVILIDSTSQYSSFQYLFFVDFSLFLTKKISGYLVINFDSTLRSYVTNCNLYCSF